MAEEVQAVADIVHMDPGLAQRIQEELGQNVYLCYQCVKCTSGCPIGKYFDWQPNQIMRAVQLGQEEIALRAQHFEQDGGFTTEMGTLGFSRNLVLLSLTGRFPEDTKEQAFVRKKELVPTKTRSIGF